GLAGADTFRVAGGMPFLVLTIEGGGSAGDTAFFFGADATAESVTIAPDATDPTLQTINGLGPVITPRGVAPLRYTGTDGDDTLTVSTGPQNDTILVANAGVVDIDQVTVASLPVIQFQGLNTFVLDPGAGSDSATFITASLGGALPSNYRV